MNDKSNKQYEAGRERRRAERASESASRDDDIRLISAGTQSLRRNRVYRPKPRSRSLAAYYLGTRIPNSRAQQFGTERCDDVQSCTLSYTSLSRIQFILSVTCSYVDDQHFYTVCLSVCPTVHPSVPLIFSKQESRRNF